MTLGTIKLMLSFAARLSKLLRTSLLALLVLGLAVNPALAFVGELHGADHALLVEADGHHHDDAGLHDDAPGSDHTDGTHGLLHQSSSGGAFTDCVAVIALPAAAFGPVVFALPATTSAPLQHLTGPFRPPIA